MKNSVTILVLSLITLVVWIGYQLIQINTKPLPEPTQEQIRELDPTLDTQLLEQLRNAPK